MMIRSEAEASSAAISCSSRRRKVLNSQTCSMIWHCWPTSRKRPWQNSFTRIPVTGSSKVARSTNRFASFHRCHTGGSVTVVFMSSRATLLLIPNSRFCQVNMPGFSPREPSTSHPRDTLGLGPRGQRTSPRGEQRLNQRCISEVHRRYTGDIPEVYRTNTVPPPMFLQCSTHAYRTHLPLVIGLRRYHTDDHT